MQIEAGPGNIVEIYHKLVDIVNPRPIAWVTTIDLEGRVNLAPFSFFNAFGANPAVVGFAPSLRRDGTKKDTLQCRGRGEFVVNSAVASLANEVNLSSSELPYGESEVDLTGLHLPIGACDHLRLRPPWPWSAVLHPHFVRAQSARTLFWSGAYDPPRTTFSTPVAGSTRASCKRLAAWARLLLPDDRSILR